MFRVFLPHRISSPRVDLDFVGQASKGFTELGRYKRSHAALQIAAQPSVVLASRALGYSPQGIRGLVEPLLPAFFVGELGLDDGRENFLLALRQLGRLVDRYFELFDHHLDYTFRVQVRMNSAT